MNFRVSIAREAEKLLDRLDRQTEQRIRTRFVHLSVDPFDAILDRLGFPISPKSPGGIRKSDILVVDTRGQVYKHS